MSASSNTEKNHVEKRIQEIHERHRTVNVRERVNAFQKKIDEKSN